MEWFTTEDGKYRIESLSSTTFDGALRVVRDSLCQDEYVSIALGVNKNPKAAEELLELGAETALDGLSLVAVAVESGEVVSVSFNKLQVLTTDATEKSFFDIFAEERCTQASSRSLIQFMANVDVRCNLFEKFGVDCSLEIMYLATLREHRHRKLATLLCKYSTDVARKIKGGIFAPIEVEDLGKKYSHLQQHKHIEKSPEICQAIWTTPGSQKIGEALNFTVHLKVPYSEYVYDGKTFSERIGDRSAFFQVAALIL